MSVIEVKIVYSNAALVRQQQSWEFASALINFGTWGFGVRVCVRV